MNRLEFVATLVSLGAAGPSPSLRYARGDDTQHDQVTQYLRVLHGQGNAQQVDPGSFLFNGKRFRGTFARSEDGRIISTVPLEQYLYSVVSREMPVSWPGAALQAQAICARTYVLQRSNPLRDYDVGTGEADQVYEGIAAEKPSASAAVDATNGQVLRFGNAFATIAYSSCCGGHTESAADAWSGGSTAPYLSGVSCPWCTASPDYNWTRDVTRDAVRSAFSAGSDVPDSFKVEICGSDPSGRASNVCLMDGDGQRATITGAQFRSRLGGRVVRSLLIKTIAPNPDGFTIVGGGLGHGVGLCQWGAKGMALAQNAARDILGFYFPGTTLGHD